MPHSLRELAYVLSNTSKDCKQDIERYLGIERTLTQNYSASNAFEDWKLINLHNYNDLALTYFVRGSITVRLESSFSGLDSKA